MVPMFAALSGAALSGSDVFHGEARVWNDTHVTVGNVTRVRAFGCYDITAGCPTCFNHQTFFEYVCVWCRSDGHCHDVGSLQDPCGNDECVSQAVGTKCIYNSLSDCDVTPPPSPAPPVPTPKAPTPKAPTPNTPTPPPPPPPAATTLDIQSFQKADCSDLAVDNTGTADKCNKLVSGTTTAYYKFTMVGARLSP
jgi:hypothetical protein